MQKAQDAISMEDLDTLMGKSARELMLSHVHKLMQVCVLVPLSYASSFSFSFFFFNSHLLILVGARRVLVYFREILGL